MLPFKSPNLLVRAANTLDALKDATLEQVIIRTERELERLLEHDGRRHFEFYTRDMCLCLVLSV